MWELIVHFGKSSGNSVVVTYPRVGDPSVDPSKWLKGAKTPSLQNSSARPSRRCTRPKPVFQVRVLLTKPSINQNGTLQGRERRISYRFRSVSSLQMEHCCARYCIDSPKPRKEGFKITGPPFEHRAPRCTEEIGVRTLTVPASNADETRMH